MSQEFPSAVLWDMDGTIIDSESCWMRAEQDLANRYGAKWDEHSGEKLVGLSLYESAGIMKTQMGISDLDSSQIIEFLTQRVMAQLGEAITWRPGAVELLKECRNRGIATALVTMSMRRNAMLVVEQLDFDAFDLVVAGDDVNFGKPHPEPYLTAARQLGVEPASCVAFEDSLNGLVSAEAAGTVAIGVPNILPIPVMPDRILLETLAGVTLDEVARIFRDRRRN